ncbi:MAG: alpha/beta hydrolase [Desulfomonilia bacterium]|jgi:pimeloyl-ACP methyl ester carboxylesterase|nr:alpha/beta hydrolase [Deltaproteobacteria bacterium]MDX9761075.1 alpha/beta hydrolase [Desulfomonilia bacterium]HPW68669.1 alpha/beta hydrolase [Deltaproteobacteria bacterium]
MSSARSKEFFFTIPGGTIHAKQWVPENLRYKVPVVLLHDSLGSIDLWRDFPEKLAGRLSRTVFAYDRLGFGKSSARDARPSKAFVWEEADIYFPSIKEALSLDRYVLFGHSVGGAMSIAIAASRADCSAVITEAAQAFVEEVTVSGIQNAKKVFRDPDQIKRIEKWHGSKAQWVLRAWIDVWLSPEFASWSLEKRIGRVRCPLLAIHGDKDEFGSLAFPEFISERAGGESEMVILENCGHVPHRERPQEVMDHAASFLDRHGID